VPLFAWCDRCPCSVCLARWRAHTGMGGGGAVASQQQRCHENEKRRRHGLSERLAVASQLPARWIFHTCALVTQGRGESLLSPVRQSRRLSVSYKVSVTVSAGRASPRTLMGFSGRRAFRPRSCISPLYHTPPRSSYTRTHSQSRGSCLPTTTIQAMEDADRKHSPVGPSNV
jgi:hypothetical protein